MAKDAGQDVGVQLAPGHCHSPVSVLNQGRAFRARLCCRESYGSEGAVKGHAKLAAACARLTGPLAVRSSGAGEDSATASFAGQHATVLGVRGLPAVTQAVEAVWRSASSEAALAYRRRMGVSPAVRIGVVIQEMVAADAAACCSRATPSRAPTKSSWRQRGAWAKRLSKAS